jgi:spoIIIJ-associated protein
VDIETMPVEVQAERASEFAAGLVRAMGFDARVEADVDDDDVLVRIEGDGLGVLVGPRGATLQAVEELVRAVMQHISGGHSARVHVDVGGYRERRRAALAAFAEQIAAEVRETGSERALEPMSPPDRKVVHDALAEVEGVTTGSEGEEPRRRVVIRPA